MLPGSPIVRYSGSGIEYDYGATGLTIKFGLFGDPKVVYRNRVPYARHVKNGFDEAKKCADSLFEQTGIPKLVDRTAEGAKNLAVNVRNGLEDGAQMLTAPAASFIQATPIGSLLKSNPEEQATRQRDCEVRAAAQQKLDLDAYIPTLR